MWCDGGAAGECRVCIVSLAKTTNLLTGMRPRISRAFACVVTTATETVYSSPGRHATLTHSGQLLPNKRPYRSNGDE